MNPRDSACCAICGEVRTGNEGWFLLVENRWTDRLRILRFNEALARQNGVYSVCGSAHAEQLVVHWMTTGRLDYPFARTARKVRGARVNEMGCGEGQSGIPDLPGPTVVSELAVDREMLTRVLRENPASLTTILEALLKAMAASSQSMEALAKTEVMEEAMLTPV